MLGLERYKEVTNAIKQYKKVGKEEFINVNISQVVGYQFLHVANFDGIHYFVFTGQ
jgi:hypothetical protein